MRASRLCVRSPARSSSPSSPSTSHKHSAPLPSAQVATVAQTARVQSLVLLRSGASDAAAAASRVALLSSRARIGFTRQKQQRAVCARRRLLAARRWRPKSRPRSQFCSTRRPSSADAFASRNNNSDPTTETTNCNHRPLQRVRSRGVDNAHSPPLGRIANREPLNRVAAQRQQHEENGGARTKPTTRNVAGSSEWSRRTCKLQVVKAEREAEQKPRRRRAQQAATTVKRRANSFVRSPGPSPSPEASELSGLVFREGSERESQFTIHTLARISPGPSNCIA